MGFTANGALRYVLIGVVVFIVGNTAWKHRNDDWVKNLLRPPGPANTAIKFDNGSFKDAVTPPEKPASAAQAQANNDPGKLKKCLRGKEVLYTDQPCPNGSAVAAVNGGNVTVIGGQKAPPAAAAPSPQEGRNKLRDALDMSGNDNIRQKMMDRAINQ